MVTLSAPIEFLFKNLFNPCKKIIENKGIVQFTLDTYYNKWHHFVELIVDKKLLHTIQAHIKNRYETEKNYRLPFQP